jgi:hypothetical protein
MKMFIVRIAYTDYAVTGEDALALIGIADRVRVVKQNNWTGPYIVEAEQEAFCTTVTLADVIEGPVEAVIPEPAPVMPPPPDDDLTPF